MLIFVIGFAVHVIFLLSVFDVYFKSPILNDLPVIENPINPQAKRLVLIVGDGLRTDSLYGSNINGVPNAPYLRSVLETKASWGVSHTRVPTESRPGHIAMIAGFYEDPSAIFKGWQDNLFEFDSLFNRSFLTLGWGSPDIVPMFNKGNLAKNMVLKSYPAEDQSFFGSKESSFRLNSWVFNAVNETLNFAEFEDSGKQLNKDLHQNGVVLFLHLLATDVSGHSDKPKSGEFFDILNKTDAGIKAIVDRLERFFKSDGKTLYVFTSDHGMTDWGSHGDGSDVETETPFIIWGPGVKRPEILDSKREDDPWGLSHLARRDLRQADIVPLLALLIGIPIPVHSVGVIPIDFLNVSDAERAAMLQLNMKQINMQYLRRRDDIKGKSLPLFYYPFKKLPDSSDLEMKMKITSYMSNQQYTDAVLLNQKLIHLSLEAIDYYQNYYQYLLLGCVAVSYFGWIFVLLTGLAKNFYSKHARFKASTGSLFSSIVKFSIVDCIFFSLIISITSFISVQGLPLQFYVYSFLPVFLWWFAFRNNAALLFKSFFQSCHTLWIQMIGYMVGIELFVLTFFHRWAISVVLLALPCWPLSNYGTLHRKKCTFLLYLWTSLSLGLAVFPFLPVTGLKPSIYYVVMSGVLWLTFISSVLFTPMLRQFFIFKSEENNDHYLSWNVSRHILGLTVTIYNCAATFASHSAKESLLKHHQILSWILLGNSIIVPVNFIGIDVSFRLVILFLSMAAPTLLLSIGQESLFYFLFSAHLLVWFALEYQLAPQVPKGIIGGTTANLSPGNWRRGFFFLTFILLSFFGAGNIASVNSFDVLAVQRFLTVFSPFIMMSLILLKLLIPFLLVVATTFCLYIKINDSVNQLLLIVFIFCDLLGLHFLFLVKNVGSWKEIGMSLSHFVIVESFILFVLLILGLAHFYLKDFRSKNFFSLISQHFSSKTVKNKKIY